MKHVMNLTYVFFAAFLALATLPMASSESARAKISQKADGQRKINLSGRQRMLSQFMAKAACFASVDVRTAYHLNQMGQTHWLFSETLSGLKNGNETLGLLPERNLAVLAGLKSVEEEWADYAKAVVAWRSGTARTDGTLEIIFEKNIPTLFKMNATVKLFEQSYSAAGTVDPGIAVALNISGRQRMLTQKASKEACLIYRGYQAAHNRAELLKTMNLFAKSLDDLLQGNTELGLPAAPISVIQDQLNEVKALWKSFEVQLLRIQNGDTPELEDLKRIAEQNEPLLYEMNKAVWLYETVK